MQTIGFEVFDHTADAGIRFAAPTPEGLFAAGPGGLYALIGDLVPGAEVRRDRMVFEAEEPALAFRDFLSELLHLFEIESLMATAVDVTSFSEQSVHVDVTLASVDPDRSTMYREVKAITYHALSFSRGPQGCEACVIVDI